jgi:hypothetical protein
MNSNSDTFTPSRDEWNVSGRDISASALTELMKRFDGGSMLRYRHDLKSAFIFTEGVRAVVIAAGADWLLNLLAFDYFPVIKKAFYEDEVRMMQVKLKVDAEQRNAKLVLKLVGNARVLKKEEIGTTSFPPGDWYFYIYPVLENNVFFCDMILLYEY